jgi:cytochrome b6-f complex iron-sulfur subunit
MSDIDNDRRRFCQAALALAGTALIPACGGSGASGAQCKMAPVSSEITNEARAVSTGLMATDVPMNSAVARMTSQINIFVARDDCGLYAMDAGCTHLGTNVNFVSAKDGFLCPLHGAKYDFNGENQTAPAPSPLKHYAISTLPSGELLVDVTPEGVVDADVRLKG